MTRRAATWLAVMVVLAAVCGGGRAADWPQFGGCDRSHVSPETGLVRSFPEGGPPVLWRLDVEPGFGGAAARNGRVYFMGSDYEAKTESLRCVDLETGKPLWEHCYAIEPIGQHGGTRSVPTVTESMVYAVGQRGHVHAIDLETHEVVWSAHLRGDFRSRRIPYPWLHRPPQYGWPQHPQIYGDTVILAPFQPDAGVVAFDAATGEVRWRSPGVGLNVFNGATPWLVRLRGVDQVVILGNTDWHRNPPVVITSVDARTGRQLWQLATWHRCNVPVPSPVGVGAGRLIFSAGYTIGCFALDVEKPDEDGAPWAVTYGFRNNQNLTSHIHNPVFYRSHIFGQSFDTFHNRGNHGLVCLTTDGEMVWRSADTRGPDRDGTPGGGRPVTFDNGHFLIADGLILVMDGDTGELNLVEASTERFNRLAVAKILEAADKTVWAPMVLADGCLIARDQHEMVCVDLQASRQAAD